MRNGRLAEVEAAFGDVGRDLIGGCIGNGLLPSYLPQQTLLKQAIMMILDGSSQVQVG